MPHSFIPDLPEWLSKLLNGLGAFVISASAGRLMWHTRLVQLGKRNFFSLHLAWEIPTAISMALIGRGLGEYLGLSENASLALVATLSYLGPRGIETVFTIWLNRTNPPSPPSQGAPATQEFSK